MNKSNRILLAGIALLMVLLSACDILSDVYDTPTSEKKEGQYYVDATDYA
jgi:hypothetical protein